MGLKEWSLDPHSLGACWTGRSSGPAHPRPIGWETLGAGPAVRASVGPWLLLLLGSRVTMRTTVFTQKELTRQSASQKLGKWRFRHFYSQSISVHPFLLFLGPLLPMEQAFTMAEPRGPVDHGVQIRFITEPAGATEMGPLRHGGRRPAKDARASSYGVAVRVQGIAGQPFVVLNSGEKGGGDSFGVQIKGANNRGAPGAPSSDSELPENPYSRAREFLGASRDSMSDEEPGALWHGRLLRSQSQASLTGPAPMGPGDRSTSMLELAPRGASPGGAIDTAPLSSVDSLITKFDSRRGGQARGRTGRRMRSLPPEERKRSQSLDTRLPRDTLGDRELRSPSPWSPSAVHDNHLAGLRQPAQSQSPPSGFSRSRQTHDWVLQSFEEPRGRTPEPTVLQVRPAPLPPPNPGPGHQPWDPLLGQIPGDRKSLPCALAFLRHVGKISKGRMLKERVPTRTSPLTSMPSALSPPGHALCPCG